MLKEWKEFFEEYGTVVALKDGSLVVVVGGLGDSFYINFNMKNYCKLSGKDLWMFFQNSQALGKL